MRTRYLLGKEQKEYLGEAEGVPALLVCSFWRADGSYMMFSVHAIRSVSQLIDLKLP